MKPATLAAALVASVAVPGWLFAYEAQTQLGSFMLTDLQRATGDAVTVVCGQLGGLGSLRTDAQNDLFDRCGNMVGNGRELAGDTSPPAAKSLGLNEAELSAAVQTVANEELAATKSFATEIGVGQTNVAIARLQALRSGVRFDVAGLTPEGNDAFAGADPRFLAEMGATGGAAGDAALGKWGFFLNGHYGTGDRDGTDRENDFDFDRGGITGGVDYRIRENFILGGLLSYHKIDSEFKKSAAVPGGGIETDAWGLGAYGTYYQDNYYVDGLIGYNQADYDIARRIRLPLGSNPGADPAAQTTNRRALANTDSKSWGLSLGGGIDFAKENLNYGPFLRVNYVRVDVDGYKERGAFGLNLTVDDQDWKSLTSVLGGRISGAYSQTWGVVVPQARLGWVHEYENNAQTFTAFYTVDPNQNPLIARTDSPDRNYFELGVGVSAVLPNNLQAFLNYDTLLGHDYITDHVFTAGVRSSF
jgi:uncharacterized protein with beta-barrel porin domain